MSDIKILIPLIVLQSEDVLDEDALEEDQTTPPLSHPMIKSGTREPGPEERQKPLNTKKGKTRGKDLKRGAKNKRNKVSTQPK